MAHVSRHSVSTQGALTLLLPWCKDKFIHFSISAPWGVYTPALLSAGRLTFTLPSHSKPGSQLYCWVDRGTFRVKSLAQGVTTSFSNSCLSVGQGITLQILSQSSLEAVQRVTHPVTKPRLLLNLADSDRLCYAQDHVTTTHSFIHSLNGYCYRIRSCQLSNRQCKRMVATGWQQLYSLVLLLILCCTLPQLWRDWHINRHLKLNVRKW